MPVSRPRLFRRLSNSQIFCVFFHHFTFQYRFNEKKKKKSSCSQGLWCRRRISASCPWMSQETRKSVSLRNKVSNELRSKNIDVKGNNFSTTVPVDLFGVSQNYWELSSHTVMTTRYTSLRNGKKNEDLASNSCLTNQITQSGAAWCGTRSVLLRWLALGFTVNVSFNLIKASYALNGQFLLERHSN